MKLTATQINDLKGKAAASTKEIVGCDIKTFGIEDKKADMKTVKASVSTKVGDIEVEVDIDERILERAVTSPQTAAFVAVQVSNAIQRGIINAVTG